MNGGGQQLDASLDHAADRARELRRERLIVEQVNRCSQLLEVALGKPGAGVVACVDRPKFYDGLLCKIRLLNATGV
jgi:hypothetical protein